MEAKTFIKNGTAETKLLAKKLIYNAVWEHFGAKYTSITSTATPTGRNLQPYAGRWYNAVPSVIFG